MNPKAIGWAGTEWVHPAQHMDHWCALTNSVFRRCPVCHLLLGLFLDPEDGGSIFLQNIGEHPSYSTASQPQDKTVEINGTPSSMNGGEFL
jgi:hypothetical protein